MTDKYYTLHTKKVKSSRRFHQQQLLTGWFQKTRWVRWYNFFQTASLFSLPAALFICKRLHKVTRIDSNSKCLPPINTCIKHSIPALPFGHQPSTWGSNPTVWLLFHTNIEMYLVKCRFTYDIMILWCKLGKGNKLFYSILFYIGAVPKIRVCIPRNETPRPAGRIGMPIWLQQNRHTDPGNI